MSDNIPFEIQMEIIQRIPDPKSLIQFRSVSKAWKSVIDSKDFVTAHTLRQQAHNRHHLLIRKRDGLNTPLRYVSVVDDDDTFPNQEVSVFVPDSVNKSRIDLLGTSHGLFFLYELETRTAVIWNPSIRKTVTIRVPNVLCVRPYWTIVGFGVCPCGLDPKLVKISFVSDLSRLHDVSTSTQVEVFTLRSGGTWRSPLCSNIPHKSIRFGYSQAVVDGFIYWNVVHWIDVDHGFRNHNLIMSFDLTTEEFTKVNLPDCLALKPRTELPLSKLRESLAILEFSICNGRESCDVWMMIGYGCTRSFNKLYSISAPYALLGTTVGFRKSGTPVVDLKNDNVNSYHAPVALAIYEPESKNITNIGIYGMRGSFYVHSYMKTLLLLGH